jgi:hypothetical protein
LLEKTGWLSLKNINNKNELLIGELCLTRLYKIFAPTICSYDFS